MDAFFKELVSNLTIDDMLVLSYLSDNQINTLYKSVTRHEIQEGTNLSTSMLRKTLLKLETLCFVRIDIGSKKYKMFITRYGQTALQMQIEKEEVK